MYLHSTFNMNVLKNGTEMGIGIELTTTMGKIFLIINKPLLIQSVRVVLGKTQHYLV